MARLQIELNRKNIQNLKTLRKRCRFQVSITVAANAIIESMFDRVNRKNLIVFVGDSESLAKIRTR